MGKRKEGIRRRDGGEERGDKKEGWGRGRRKEDDCGKRTDIVREKRNCNKESKEKN